jgi:hypothetical protein
MHVAQDLNSFWEIIAHAQYFVKKSFGPMIADHDLVKKR